MFQTPTVYYPFRTLFPRAVFVSVALTLLSSGSAARAAAEGKQATQPVKPAAFAEVPETDAGLPGAGPLRRAPWFRKLWSERRQAFAAAAEADRGAVVFLGDSITQGWKELLAKNFPDLKAANRGISGDTTRGLLLRLEGDVLAVQPKGVVLLIGTNDLEERAEPGVIAANVRLLLAALHRHQPQMPVVLCAVLPSSTTKARPATKIQTINQLYATFSLEFPNVTFVDTWTLFANPLGDAKAEEMPDLLHPNAVGYTKLAAGLRPILATLGWLDTAPDEFTPEPGFVSLFDGRTLDGWGYRATSEDDLALLKRAGSGGTFLPWPIVPESVSFAGRTASPDGRFVAKNGRLIVTIPAEGRRIQKLQTTREFPQDFILKLEFRASPNADSGVYVRGPQLQCRDYLLAGPYRELKQYRPQEWNELVIEVRNGSARCTCNGELLVDAMKVPATGPIGVEGDRGQMEYRRIRLKELP